MKHCNHINFFRAILIALMILIHITHFGDLYPEVKYAVLAFIMPTFLVITGYLVNVNKPVKAFVAYLLKILLPYGVMVFGFAVLSLYLPVRDGLESFTWPALYKVFFITSIGPYWFLHVMMVCGTIYYLSFRLFEKMSVGTRLSVFATLLILTALYTPFLAIKPAAYYFIGVLIRVCFKDFSKAYGQSWWAVLPFGLLVSNPQNHDWGTLAVLACVFCFLSFTAKASELVKGRTLQLMDYIGRNTFPIYIFHPIFTMLGKYLLPVFSFDSTGMVHAAVVVVLGLAGSIGIAQAMDWMHLSYVFGRKNLLR